jgi:hypothetical protein
MVESAQTAKDGQPPAWWTALPWNATVGLLMANRAKSPLRVKRVLRNAWQECVGLVRYTRVRRCARPSFIIIGAQKAGTNSLFWYLSRHNAIRIPVRKELHFFDRHFSRGARWYQSRFPFSTSGTITGEATPYYIFHPLAAERIHQFDPDVRLIALLRDPVSRAYSHYQREKSNGRETRPFRQAVEESEEEVESAQRQLANRELSTSPSHRYRSYFARGRYVEQLDRYRRIFPAKHLYIATAERLFRDPDAICSEVLEFLRLPQQKISDGKAYNARSYNTIDPADRAWLAEKYRVANLELANSYQLDISHWS